MGIRRVFIVFLPRHSGSCHGFGRQDLVELPLGEQLSLPHEIPDRSSCLNRRLSDVGGCLVSNVGTERRRQSRAAIQQFTASLFVGARVGDAPVLENTHGIRHDARRMNGIPRDDRHHDIQLELTRIGGRENRRVAAVHLETELIDHLGYGRVLLAGLDRGSLL
jgi:hypothetical protein